MFIKGHLDQHQERFCKSDLSITFTIALWLSFQNFKFFECRFSHSANAVYILTFDSKCALLNIYFPNDTSLRVLREYFVPFIMISFILI